MITHTRTFLWMYTHSRRIQRAGGAGHAHRAMRGRSAASAGAARAQPAGDDGPRRDGVVASAAEEAEGDAGGVALRLKAGRPSEVEGSFAALEAALEAALPLQLQGQGVAAVVKRGAFCTNDSASARQTLCVCCVSTRMEEVLDALEQVGLGYPFERYVYDDLSAAAEQSERQSERERERRRWWVCRLGGSEEDELLPRRLQSLTRVVAVSAGRSHCVPVDEQGKARVWGVGGHGRPGLGDAEERWTPTLV
eukprot:CAMPEP_0170142644 /NCGR_PEP_ID=MMETSP0033_2-20121228/7758_1 /TAXON_ID=195969 /ORGANISM="Dolichomastix tenuilepis, Strain CCMP3274" /LENGTH=250 /DNA_ID=CAMNT_0010378989 /DNA_START=35 /DNA_END=786 /DNA_ORIENTATION=+